MLALGKCGSSLGDCVGSLSKDAPGTWSPVLFLFAGAIGGPAFLPGRP